MASLPDGRYLSAFGRVRAAAGGKTTAALARNRLLTTRFGIETSVLSFDLSDRYDDVRAELRQRQSLVPGMHLLNLFEWYREAGVESFAVANDGQASSELAEIEHIDRVDIPSRDGTPLVTEYLDAEGALLARDHRRVDGSVFVRVTRGGQGGSGAVVLVDHGGRPVRAWPSRRGWHRHWLGALTQDVDRVVLFTDTTATLGQLWPIDDPRVLHVHVLHEVHLRTGGHDLDNAALQPGVQPLFDHLGRLDALVTLTDRQRVHVVDRARPGLTRVATIPHPAPEVDRTPRDREAATFVTIGRLTELKRVHETIEAFALLAHQRPDARLHVYGDGPLRGQLQQLVEERALGGQVWLHGFDPSARERLRRATAFVSTSRKESFGLAALEALSQGCPVVAYDVPYGLPEMVEENVSGHLVADGDRAALAQALLGLIEAPDRVRRLSRGALDGAARYAPARVAEAWRDLLVALTR